MNRLCFTLAFLLAVACSGLHAQTTTMQANIPFDFWLGKTALPAGSYEIHYSKKLLQVRQAAGGPALASEYTIPEYRLESPANSALQFSRYGNVYFLTRLWSPRLQGGCMLQMSRQEKELLSNAATTQSVLVALRPK